MIEYKILLERAARLCSSGEKCEYDIREKLLKWGMEKENVEKSIKYLLENKFIDDSRYASYFVKDKLKFNKWGRIKINFALRQKKIKSEIIEAALSEIDNDLYDETLDQIVKSKIDKLGDPEKMEIKAKILRFASQRGFSSEEIYKSLSRVSI